MKTLVLCATIAAGLAAIPSASHAANARNPYGNVDKRLDKGNDTGDSKVDQLNDAQLNKNYQGQNPGDSSAKPR